MHDKFVYVITSEHRMYVGIASNPFVRVKSHNRTTGYPPGARITKQDAPHWKVKVVLGPFTRSSHLYREWLLDQITRHRYGKLCILRNTKKCSKKISSIPI